MEDLERFLTAQNGKSIHGNTLYEQALIEIQEGKLGFECWIRYVYPQLKRKGTSPLTEFYGIKNRDEAKAYIKHPVLRERLIPGPGTKILYAIGHSQKQAILKNPEQ